MVEVIMQVKQAKYKSANTISSYLHIEPEKAAFIETENGKMATEEQEGN